MKIGDLVRLKSSHNAYGNERIARYTLYSGEPIVRVADISLSGAVRVVNKETLRNEAGDYVNYKMSTWFERNELDYEIVNE